MTLNSLIHKLKDARRTLGTGDMPIVLNIDGKLTEPEIHIGVDYIREDEYQTRERVVAMKV